jgi:DNA-binding CsgD family transcriptional regulator
MRQVSPLPASPLNVLLEISTESGTSRMVVRGDTVRLGRAVDNDVVLANETTVSRFHAELLFDEDGWFVRDVGSHNGTHVNGERLTADIIEPVGPSDVIGLGTVTIRLSTDLASDGLTVDSNAAFDAHRLLTILSKRETEVLTLVASGRTDDQAAAELFISVKTVHSHLDRIKEKTGARRRAELTRLAVRLGLRASNE